MAAAAVCLGTVALPSAAMAVPAAPSGYLALVQDLRARPGQSNVDSISIGYYSPTFPPPGLGKEHPSPQVYRSGRLIASAGSSSFGLEMDDLREGDEIRIVDGGDHADDPILGSFIYRAQPKLDAPLCAGATQYSGSRGADSSSPHYDASAVLWTQGSAAYPGYPGYPGYPTQYPGSQYPGYSPGWSVAQAMWLTGAATSADRFALQSPHPLVAGMDVYIWANFQPASNVALQLETDQLVQDCTTKPTPTATPTSTPAPTQEPESQPVVTPTPQPTGDKTPPKGSLTSVTSRELRKLGRTKLFGGGLPITVKSDEPARLVGTLTLLGGKKPFVSTVSINVIKGISITHLPLSKAMQKQIKKAKHPRLRLDAVLVDGAGNRQPLPPIAVNVPGR